MNRLNKALALALAVFVLTTTIVEASDKKKKKKGGKDPYAELVWPPPPAKARIKLEHVIAGRADVVAKGKLKRKLLGSSPTAVYDDLLRPYSVAIDGRGRFLVTDSEIKAVIRFDLEGRVMDVLGTTGPYSLVYPLGMHIAEDETIYVADATGGKVVAYEEDGTVIQVYGAGGDLVNPADVITSPDGSRVLVADSKAHHIVVFDRESGEVLDTIGKQGNREGTFNFPTSMAFDPDGNLFVVDTQNARVQVFDLDYEYLDVLGERGTGPGQFTRPRDIAIDEVGFIYVTDFAFNNIQIFDIDFSVLTFVGTGGMSPGSFSGLTGVAVRGDTIAAVDQLGERLQILRFIVPKDE
jgi:DNA-binding beta-propeller fold protein YncE